MLNSIYAENVTDSTSSEATSPFGLPFVMGDWTPYSVNIWGAEGVIFLQANPERDRSRLGLTDYFSVLT